MNYNTGETTDETFTYDAAGNIITTADNCDTDSFSYDKNNRLTYHNGMSVTYDADGNMTSAYHDGSRDSFRYDSTNRLIGTNTNAYTYNAENVRIRNLCGEHETTYVYNTNAKLSSMLMKTTDGVVTKYVYGRGLIGEETNGNFKVYHFDYRGSTVAITDINGNVTDRFEYDTYGKLTSRTGNSDVIFLYNGRDGVVTDANGLIYMRARYYSPELRRFINADILAGRIDNAVTLNRYAYANGNPVSMIDPRGLSAERDRYGSVVYNGATYSIHVPNHLTDDVEQYWNTVDTITVNDYSFDWVQFISGVGADDVKDIIYGLNQNLTTSRAKQLDVGVRAMGVIGLLNAALDSISNTYVTFEFQEYDEKKRVIITYGSSDAMKVADEYADNKPRYYSTYNRGVIANDFMDDLYTVVTGKEVGIFDYPDLRVTVDKRHKGSGDIAYLSIAEDGTVMQTPIVYPNDEVAIGKHTGFLYLEFETEVTFLLGKTTPVNQDLQDKFNAAMNKHKISS